MDKNKLPPEMGSKTSSLTFDRQTSSFRLPEPTPTPKFSPPLIRSTSMSSSNQIQRRIEPSSSSISQSPLTSYSGLYDTEHRGQHQDYPACRKILQRIQHHKQRQNPSLGMFSLPRQNDAYEAINQGQKSYFPGRNL